MLKYDINSICALEGISGKTIVEIFSDTKALEAVSLQRKLYWAGRLHEDDKLTLSGAGDELQKLVHGGKPLAAVMEDITKALMATGIFPDKPEEPEGNPTSPA